MSPVVQRAELFGKIELVLVDIDGTLTDATTWWGGPEVGWVQRYSVRDGEAILRLSARGLPVVPLSRNATRSATQRMSGLRLDHRWLGVNDKSSALGQIWESYPARPERTLYVADGLEDLPVFAQIGVGVAVADAHPRLREAATYLAQTRGGEGVMAEIEMCLIAARPEWGSHLPATEGQPR